VCKSEVFDVTPTPRRCAYYLLGHPDTQGFRTGSSNRVQGAKRPCALVSIHDLGGIAATRMIDGKVKRGFEIYVGGGLGAVPQSGNCSKSSCRRRIAPAGPRDRAVFARLGEKKNRNKARLKFWYRSRHRGVSPGQ